MIYPAWTAPRTVLWQSARRCRNKVSSRCWATRITIYQNFCNMSGRLRINLRRVLWRIFSCWGWCRRRKKRCPRQPVRRQRRENRGGDRTCSFRRRRRKTSWRTATRWGRVARYRWSKAISTSAAVRRSIRSGRRNTWRFVMMESWHIIHHFTTTWTMYMARRFPCSMWLWRCRGRSRAVPSPSSQTVPLPNPRWGMASTITTTRVR